MVDGELVAALSITETISDPTANNLRTMRAAFCSAPGTIAVRDVAEPVLGAGEVLVQVRACGICGSDLHWFHGTLPAPAVCPGHEIAGEVVAGAPDVSGFSPGARVAVEPMVVCRECHYCRTGRPQLCPQLRIIGLRRPGGFAERVAVPAYALFALPDEIDWPLAALTEPTAVAVHAVRLGGVSLGHRVLVLGTGSLGLLCAFAARAAGAAEVLVSARYPQQRTMAERLGAAEAGRAADGSIAADLGADVVIETVGGSADTLGEAVRVVRPAGTVVVLGVFASPPPVPALALLAKEVRVMGSLMYDRTGARADFQIAVELIRQHRAVLVDLITHRMPLGDIQHAFVTASDKRAGAIKVVVLP